MEAVGYGAELKISDATGVIGDSLIVKSYRRRVPVFSSSTSTTYEKAVFFHLVTKSALLTSGRFLSINTLLLSLLFDSET